MNESRKESLNSYKEPPENYFSANNNQNNNPSPLYTPPPQ